MSVNTEVSRLRFHGKPGQVAPVEMTKGRVALSGERRFWM
jgi:hypothetical protein